MAQITRLTSYGRQVAETSYSDDRDSSFHSYRSNPSMAARGGDGLADDPVPLFLSGSDEEPDPREFQPDWDREDIANRPARSSRILKACILTFTVAAIGLVLMSVENPLALFARVNASLPGMAANHASSGPPVAAAQPVVASYSPPVARETPTRDEIAAAFKTAHLDQPDINALPVAAPAPAPPTPAPPPVRRIEAGELAGLLKRAKSLIATGDIAAARLLLERAADAQEANAALMLAQTYDPAVLGTPDARSIQPDPAMARAWYQKAARFGSPDAQQRLAQMQN